MFEILERGLYQPGSDSIPAVKPKQWQNNAEFQSFDTHPETMAAGLSVKHSDRITYNGNQLYLK